MKIRKTTENRINATALQAKRRIQKCLKGALVAISMLFIPMAFISSTFSLLPAPEVTTKLGEIRGKRLWHQGVLVNAFLGVPYAVPPVGNLRFKKTVPLQGYDDVVNASVMPPACPQYATQPFPWYDDEPGKKEDCLYLNIWVPTSPSKRKAVMYWIFGGGFFIGSIRKEVYNGIALAAIEDVIVVTVSYRLGSLGFLYSGTEDAPGNVGLYDMLEGLKWVNDNIEAFGGDKNRITIMGQSAGSIAVGILSVSPLTKGLYKRAIMESGSPAYVLAEDDSKNLEKSQNVAKAVNCSSDTRTIEDYPEEVVKCLRNVDAMELAKATALLEPYSSRAFLPRFGDDIVPKNPRKAIIDGDFHDTELLAGNVRDEASFSLAKSQPEVFGFFGEKNPRVNKSYGQQILRGVLSSLGNPDEIIDYYLGAVPDNDYDTIRRQTYTAIGDFTLLCPTVFFAESYAERNNVFYYFFAHRPSTTPWAPWMGPVHLEEVQFVFGLPTIYPSRYTQEEQYLSVSMMKKWAKFAKTGLPSEKWPLYSKDNPKVKVLNTSNQHLYVSGPHRENCDAYRPYIGF